MPNVVEEISSELKPAAEAALAWINQEHGAQFKLTGLVDPDKAMGRKIGQPIELGHRTEPILNLLVFPVGLGQYSRK